MRLMPTRLVLGCAVLISGASPPPAQAGAPSQPNVVFILADDWGWGDLGCYGNARLRTPNLDRLASQGALFTDFYQCGSVCSPSRAALMTGRFPARWSIHGHFARPQDNANRGMPNWLDPKATTLPGLLKQNGYVTHHVGKWHLGSGPGAPSPDQYGFTSWKMGSAGPSPDAVHSGGGDRSQSTTRIVDDAIRFIEANRDRPFYVQAWLNDTHAILNPSDEQLSRYARLAPKRLRFSNPFQVYQAVATDADAQLGRLFKRLEELGLTERTFVIFTSDNGPEAMEVTNASHSGVGSPGPFRGRKRSLYEGGIRLPFIVRGPGVPAGRVSNAIVMGADMLPTIASLTGTRVPDGLELDGEDRAPVLLGGNARRTKPPMWERRFGIIGHVLNHSPTLAIREGRWKLLMNPDRSRVELYDLSADPSETDNLAPAHPDIVAGLADRLLAWHKALPPGPSDPGAGSNAYPWPREARPAPNR